ncbi:MAG: putative rane protein [Chthoniobacteraceae bacterium]|nr:putative rane protein [Chthoniobacteraceae bacterium]
MMMFLADSIFLAGRDWLWPATGAFAIALGFIIWGAVRTAAPPMLKLGGALLKLLGMTALLICLLEPMWSGQRAKPGANLIAIVADNSLSMKLRGRGDQEMRGDALCRVVTGSDNLWRAQLAEHFEVRNYLVDSRLQTTPDFRDLTFEGTTSAIGGALSTLVERYYGQPLGGIVLLTDGIASDLDGVELQGLPPVYPVVFGGDQPPRDLAIGRVTVTQSAFEDAPVTVQAEVTAIGAAGEEVVGKLFPIEPGKPDSEQKPVGEETVTIPAADEKVVFRFQLRPEKSGVLFYRLRIASKKEWDEKLEATTEATLSNNETTVTVDRGAGPYRLLYVSGRPNWEYKFLHRAVQGDDQTQLAGLIRIAKREPKFEFRGRAGEASNPLFRGFGDQSKEATESYDKPVLVRLNTEDEFELRDGFPKTAEELFKYRAVILDDLEAEFFTAEQMSLLQKFVSERGGGLMMLGGAESFTNGKFARTAIGDMLPVYVDKEIEVLSNPALRLNFTREGLLEPWARLRPNEAEERRRLAELPTFEILNRVRETKPAAMVVATVEDAGIIYPALVTQRYGRGRTAALLIGDLWHAGLGNEALQKDLGKEWRQMVRWLVADVPTQVDLRVEPQAGSTRIQVRARDKKFQALDNAVVSLKISRAGAAPDALPLTLNAEASTSEPGLYEAFYIPRESGGYRVDASVADESGSATGSAAAGWSTNLPAAEFRDLKPNRPLMEHLASKSGGRLLKPDELAALVRELPSKPAAINETWTRPLWHTPWMFLFALACFVGEWGLRRSKGLA